VEVVAGEPLALMQAAIPLIRARFQVEVAAPYDLMIASAGGHPKDINLYQAQKALAHAAMVTKKGGTIILAVACPEGTGSDTYENWVAGMDSQEAVLEGFAQAGFFIGGHKAYQIARDAVGRRVLMVSDMDAGRVKKLLLTPVATLAEGLEIALKELPGGARVGIMPAANATIPVLKVTTI
jgi:nickel-dependent lactate racemase